MDLIKIGKFIAEKRKAKNITQLQNLSLSKVAYSKLDKKTYPA